MPDATPALTAAPTEDTPVGTRVLAWPGTRDGRAMLTRTRTPVWHTGSGIPVVSVEGYAGGIALTHVEVFPDEADAVAAALAPVERMAEEIEQRLAHSEDRVLRFWLRRLRAALAEGRHGKPVEEEAS